MPIAAAVVAIGNTSLAFVNGSSELITKLRATRLIRVLTGGFENPTTFARRIGQKAERHDGLCSCYTVWLSVTSVALGHVG